MKKNFKSIVGVTLLEIMLVLAIAAMIVVMSIRYYQSATNNQNANVVLQTIQSLTAAADTLSQATGTYTSTALTAAAIANLMPANGMVTPWGSTITLAVTSTTVYTVTIPNVTPSVCTALAARLAANNHYTVTSTCGTSTANFVYTYTSGV